MWFDGEKPKFWGATFALDSLLGRHTPVNLQRVWNWLPALALRHFSHAEGGRNAVKRGGQRS